MKNYITLIVLLLLTHTLPAQVMYTIAGTLGVSGFSGDGGPATAAKFNQPYAIAVDKKGNVYIADEGNNRVRKIDTAGIITTFAGNGGISDTGYGGPATAASTYVEGIAVDRKGNIYISNGINRILKIDTSGIINLYAGGISGYSGDGGPATSAGLTEPVDIAIDSFGNLYINDFYNFVIRKVDTLGIITTVAGNNIFGSSGDDGPATDAELSNVIGLTVDNLGNFYFSETAYNIVYKINASGIMSLFAGNPYSSYGLLGDGGPATVAIIGPSGLAADKNSNIYICTGEAIRKVNTSDTISTFAGTDTVAGYDGDGWAATDAELNYPRNIAIDNIGNLYIVDEGNVLIRKVAINEAPSAIKNISAVANNIKIFPNPVSIENNLHINGLQYASTYSIFTAIGTQIQAGYLPSGNSILSLSTLPPAVYILQITASDGQKTITKIIKQ